MTHYTNTDNPIDFPKKKKIPMLERFAAQSLVEHDGELIFSKEKFAELIVRECLSIVDDAERGGSNDIWDNAVKFIRRDLQEHFGVEE
jgi:hypothetical protein